MLGGGGIDGGAGGGGSRRAGSLHVVLMALALVAAAFLGAAVGLVWQSSGLDEDEGARPAGAGPTQPTTAQPVPAAGQMA